MIKTFKWIYKLGIAHERRRVKLLIEQNKSAKPEKPTNLSDEDNWLREHYDRELGVWFGVQETLDRLIEPTFSNQVSEVHTPLDEDTL